MKELWNAIIENKIRYLKLLRAPIKPIDKIIFQVLVFLTAMLVIPFAIFKKKTIKESIFIIFPKLMPKDLLIEFQGVKFMARRGKTDILILNELSEPWMKRYFKPNKGDVVIDVGAHVGKYSLPAAKLVGGNGKVIAIEAHPENFKALQTNILLNEFKNIIALNIAAFNQDNKKLSLSGSRDSEFSLKSNLGENCVEVETRKIDSILQELGIETVNWVKIDVEGAEVEVLQGMEKVIACSQNLKMLVEVGKENSMKVNEILRKFKRKILWEGNNFVVFYWRNRDKSQEEIT